VGTLTKGEKLGKMGYEEIIADIRRWKQGQKGSLMKLRRIMEMTNKMEFSLDKIRPELDALIKIIVDTVPVEQIYLFGSYAYGAPHKDSDLDLYIVFKDDLSMREIDALLAARTAMHQAQTMPVDLLGLKLNRFLDRKTDATLERKIAREGVKIYG
jgi:predicted nucleotidyltransferase